MLLGGRHYMTFYYIAISLCHLVSPVTSLRPVCTSANAYHFIMQYLKLCVQLHLCQY